ncbi:MAG: hypothetical protein KA515_01705 [Candidatus Pacebacteria bacterium]|nr:hypothetical protein [Candidatus Paceibacterota bacterium]
MSLEATPNRKKESKSIVDKAKKVLRTAVIASSVFGVSAGASARVNAQEVVTDTKQKETSGDLEKKFLESAVSNPDLFFANLSNFNNYPGINEYIQRIANIDPYLAVGNFPLYEDIAGSREILKSAADRIMEQQGEHNTRLILRYAEFFLKDEWGTNLVKKIVSEKWNLALDFVTKYKDLPFAKEVTEHALEEGMKQPNDSADYGETLLKNYNNYKNLIQNPEIKLKKIIDLCLSKNTSWLVVFKYFSVFENEPWGPKVIEDYVKRYPNSGLQSLEHSSTLVNTEWGRKILYRVLEQNDVGALSHYAFYKSIPNSQDIVQKAFSEQEAMPESLLSAVFDAKSLGSMPGLQSVIPDFDGRVEKAFQVFIRLNPGNAVKYATLFQDKPWIGKTIEELSDQDPMNVYKNYVFFKDIPGSKNILIKTARFVAEESPQDLFAGLYGFGISPEEREIFSKNRDIIERAVENDPTLLSSILDLEADLKMSSKESIKTLLKIHDFYKAQDRQIGRKALLFLDQVASGAVAVEDLGKIIQDDKKYFNALLDMHKKPNHLGLNGVQDEIKDMSLEIVQQINNLHESPDEVRFKVLKDLSPEKIYFLLVSAEDEIYTSSFNGIFNRLLEHQAKAGLSSEELLNRVGHKNFRTFIKLLASYNRLEDFLKTLSIDKRAQLMKDFVKNIETQRDFLAQAVTVVDTLGSIKDQAILGMLQQTVYSEYERVSKDKNKRGEVVYGLLAGIFTENSNSGNDLVRKISERYKLSDLNELSSVDLVNKDNINVQQYFFYDDEDGKNSFLNFYKQYQKPGWKIEEHPNYISIVFESKNAGPRMEIYANRPDKESEGVDDIKQIFEERKLQPQVIVHRGHSYHASATIEKIPNSAKLVSLGSCGGYNNMTNVLAMSPQAQVLSTKGTGTMRVNDPLLQMLNENILQGQGVNWPTFWSKVENKIGETQDFRNYVPPHKNLGVMFLKAYKKILIDEK